MVKSNHLNKDLKESKNDDILKIIIYIYYYEISLLHDKKEDIFYEKKEYYLINSKWFNFFKDSFKEKMIF